MVVVGAGHAGCEAALASARLGCRTLLLTLNLDRVAWQVSKGKSSFAHRHTIRPFQTCCRAIQAVSGNPDLEQGRKLWGCVQPCNPAVGGPAKSQLVHEVDALGGEMGKMADKCYLQKRILNRSKVPMACAVHFLPPEALACAPSSCSS